MDRARLQLLTTQAASFAGTLSDLPDSNESAKQRCLNLSLEIKSLLRAWNNLSSALEDPQLNLRPSFLRILDRLLADNSRIISDLRTQLALVRNQQDVYDAALRGRWVPGRHKSGHLLVLFLKQKTTILRYQQVLYAVAVLDVILGVVHHAKVVGNDYTTQEAQSVFRDQIVRLRAEAESKAVVFKEERRLGDKSVLASQWLSDVTWPSQASRELPFDHLALQWIEMVPEQLDEIHSENAPDTRVLTQAVMQLRQDLDLQAGSHHNQIQTQNQAHQSQIKQQHERHEEWKASVQNNLRQMEADQRRTEQNAKAKAEELSSRLEVQQMTIQKLEANRSQWRSHYQNQSEKLQQLEESLSTLQKNYAQQQIKLDSLQQKYEKVQKQNYTLRQNLEQSEIDKEELVDNFSKLQIKYSEAVRTNRQWVAHFESQKDRNSQIKKLQAEIAIARDEVAHLKEDLEESDNSRHELRHSLKAVEYERDNEKHRADKYKERFQGSRKECPNSFDTRHSYRRSSSRSRSASEAPSQAPSSATSYAGSATDRGSQSSTTTFVDDNGSDKEYYESRRALKRTSRPRSSKSGVSEMWGSPVQRQPALA